jgi:hypothetical protein
MFEGLKHWAKKPYSDDGDLLDWILFIGMLTCVTVLWTRVIKRLID